ncbi:hypothetical protein Sme01_19370 [Sphaerisporangium melleum]|uniref:Lanthionine synthetase n=1 Tax=Sphaerisporangium melleum TaxID=321316 RepID=A0A917RDH2_9ACTN|nr:lanthionine synthetase C family protein [Sphaerisporangium melleum]GGL02925.1 hypothetical protein GCM10007964_51270 [Sphaerisporangium melleum]GII69461.1 hypothetical protein Sme01_19370 [Sphaerisporangium melleum]
MNDDNPMRDDNVSHADHPTSDDNRPSDETGTRDDVVRSGTQTWGGNVTHEETGARDRKVAHSGTRTQAASVTLEDARTRDENVTRDGHRTRDQYATREESRTRDEHMTPGESRTRDENLAIVRDVAGRLAVPGVVHRTVTAPELVSLLAAGPPREAWHHLSLDEGYPGIVLLFAELGHTDPRAGEIAHAYLSAGAPHAAAAAAAPDGIYRGIPALAFAAAAAARRPGEYAKLLANLDEIIAARTSGLLQQENARLDAGIPGVRLAVYDVISGLTGLGRYLLSRPAACRPAAVAVAEYVVRLSRPVTVDGHEVPGWWSPDGATQDTRLHPARGHLNLGMAHGIAGPLALLALAHQHGVNVPGAGEAAHRIAEWLLSWVRTDAYGPHWPALVTFEEQVAGAAEPSRPVRPSWCYGAPGIARALQLAARAFGRPEWERTALEAVRAAVTRPVTDPRMTGDGGVCHGYAGLLQIIRLMARDTGDPALVQATAPVAGRLAGLFRPNSAFGYGLRLPGGETIPRAGFLEGAAGSALALLGHATGRQATAWDSALLLT